MSKLLLVDDDQEILNTLKTHLEQEYQVHTTTHNQANQQLEKFRPDVLIFCTDEILKNIDGLNSLTRKCRTMMILKTFSEPRMQKLFECGVTDWLIEPLNFEQLNWKLKFLIRSRKQEEPAMTLDIAGMSVKPGEHQVITNKNETVSVTPTQMRLLIAFHSFPDRLLSREWLRQKIWSNEPISPRSIDAHISKLKKLLPNLETHLESVYGKGYVWNQKEIKKSAS